MNFLKLIKNISNNFFEYKDKELIGKSEIKDKYNIEKSLIDIEKTVNNYNINKLDLVKFFYLKRNSIHYILYKYKKIIRLNFEDEMEENLSYYFYLSLLIRDNDVIINYSYSIELILKIINQTKKYNDKYYKIIISKIIIELINNYKELYEYEYNNKKIDEIEEEYNKIINENINVFNELDINLNYEDLIIKKIDEIYSKIIIALIKKNKFEDYEYTYNIIKQLGLESIDITNKMFDEIIKILDYDEDIKKKYIISKPEDLFDDKKLNFNFILLKYILKDSFFIYKTNYLLVTKKNLLVNLQNLASDNIKKLDQNQEIKLNNIIEIILDSKYYINEYNKFKSIKINNKNKSDKLNEINETTDKNKEKKDNSLKHLESGNPEDDFTKINSSMNNSYNKANHTNKYDVNTSTDEKKVETEKKQNNKEIAYNDSNINNDSTKIKKDNLEYNYNISNLKINVQDNDNNGSSNYVNNSNCKKNENTKSNNFNIMVFKKIIGTHEAVLNKKEEKKSNKKIKTTADFITEMNQIFISGGSNNLLYLYNSIYDIKKEIKTYDWIYNVFCSIKKTESLKILACSKKCLYLFDDKGSLVKSFPNQKNKINYFIGFQSNNKDNNTSYCCCEDKVVIYGDILSQIIQTNETPILEKISTKSMIQINDFLLVIKSNKIVSKGKDTLIFFNRSSKKEMEIKLNDNYSFVYTANGLAVMPIERERKENKKIYPNKVLLCACKKYIKSQKNGILLVNIKEKNYNEIEISSNFYKMSNFEAYCFCPLLKIQKREIFKDGDLCDTDYFLVGGLDLNRNKGLIKLFKVNYCIEFDQTNIEYIQDIITENKVFNGAISCIIQSNKEGDILVSCWDGNVYLFGNINIDNYLKYDNEKELYKYLTES